MSNNILADTIGSIDDKYVLEADDSAAISAVRASGKALRRRQHFMTAAKWAAGIAAAFAVSVIVPNVSSSAAQTLGNIPVIGAYFKAVTFRDWSFDDGKSSAEVHVDHIQAGSSDSSVSSEAQKAASDINLDIDKITNRLIKEFKEQVKADGYTALDVCTDVVTDNDKYYSVKLSSDVSEADSYEEVHYYTIDKTTGKEVSLKSLFAGSDKDYITEISDEIKSQMKEQMASDDSKSYWLDDPEIGDENFDQIDDDTQFYINSDNRLVIAFSQGEVAPMYMGAVEFVMPSSIF